MFYSCPPSHSRESRNLRRRIAAGNCNSCNLQFAPSARRFLLSQEWDFCVPFPRTRKSFCAEARTIRLTANEIPAFAGMAALLTS
ncbi:MAG: hypothetical protein ACR2QC_01800 [Gammaproteobacteria bacterium]